MFQQWIDLITAGPALEWIRAVGLTALVIAAAFLLHRAFLWIVRPLYQFVRARKGTRIRGLSIGKFPLVSEEVMVRSIFALLRGFRFVVTAILVFGSVRLSVSFYPWSDGSMAQEIVTGIFTSLFIFIVSISIIRGMLELHRRIEGRLHIWRDTWSTSSGGIQLMSAARIVDALLGANSLFRVIGPTMTLYLSFTLVFEQFTFTAAWSQVLWGYIVAPMREMYGQAVGYLPNFFTIVFLLVAVRYILKLVRFIFYETEQGAIDLPGFHPEWAEPTYQIVRFLIFVFTAVVIFPYLPGSQSPFFQGISVFVGVLFSFGSSSAISNIVSGTVLTYMRPFKRGDVVRIGDTTGEVIDKGMLVTRVRTPKNVDVTIPNSAVLNGQIVNYSSLAAGPGLILNTTVTIGYNVPWKIVHTLLTDAAKRCEGILAEPEPFVLQTSLNDSHISYELNAYTATPLLMPRHYSDLHRNIQETFAAAGVEIMSPLYAAVRDGGPSTIPPSPKKRKR